MDIEERKEILTVRREIAGLLRKDSNDNELCELLPFDFRKKKGKVYDVECTNKGLESTLTLIDKTAESPEKAESETTESKTIESKTTESNKIPYSIIERHFRRRMYSIFWNGI